MGFYTYSFGIRSPIKFNLYREYAESVNRGHEAILATQKKFENKYREVEGGIYNSKVFIAQVEFESEEDKRAFYSFASHIDFAIRGYGIDFLLEAYVGDFLVCNNPDPIGPLTADGRFYHEWYKPGVFHDVSSPDVG